MLTTNKSKDNILPVLWEEAVQQWIYEKQHKKSINKDIERSSYLSKFLSGKLLNKISYHDIEKIAISLQNKGRKPSTINRYLALVKSIFRIAKEEWQYIDEIPRIRMRQEPPPRVRYLTQAQANVLLNELPQHLYVMTVFALSTGLRMSNIVNLKWSQVHIRNRFIEFKATDMKNNTPLSLPLNKDAIFILKLIGKVHPEYVFTYNGKPVKRTSNSAWYKALKRAGIDDFRWHDLRHTWASWHAQNGTEIRKIQELGNWKSEIMVRRYSHFSIEHLRKEVENVNFLTN